MILIKFASRGRKEWFKRGILNIMSTIHTGDYLILVSADTDDPQMCSDEIAEFCNATGKGILVFSRSESKVHAINRDIELVMDLPWDLLVNFSDDMKFIAQGWDDIIRERISQVFIQLEEPPNDYVAHFDDGYAGEALMTMSIMDRKYYERDGYIYHPSYKSFSCDAEAMYVAMARGCHYYFQDKIFVHQHPSNTPMPNDATYLKNSLATLHDTNNYWDRLHNDFGMKEEGYKPPFPWDKFKKL